MKPTGRKKVLALISGSLCISIGFYIYYQNRYPQLTYQQHYNTKSNTEVKVDNPAKHFRSVEGNYLANNYSNSYEVGPSSSVPQPRPSPIPVGCLPYFKELHVMPVPEHDCNQPHIVMNHRGRLGNKMCQYASLYLLRHLYGVRVSITRVMNTSLSTVVKNIVLPVQDYNCFTKQTKRVKYDHVYKKLYTAASQTRTNAVNKNLITEPLLGTSYYVYNNPGPRDLMMAHRDLVRSLFMFRDGVVKKAIQNIDKALKPFNATYYDRNFSIVTVHVRRTDYNKYMKKKFNMTELNELYFTRAFQFYKERLTQPVFLVLSDDAKWCRQKLQAKNVLVIASKSPTIDMAAMTLGDHHITSYGTYSFIGALLGRGHITHPIGHNTMYNIIDCVDSSFWHYISRDETYKVDNSNVVLA